MLYIDNREHDLIALLEKNGIENYEIAALELGDIHLVHETERLVFERKKCSDLAASIKDGRFREQKQRLRSNIPSHRITYIMEGFPSFAELADRKTMLHGIAPSAFISALLSIRYRDGCHVVHTKTLQDTLSLLVEIRKRLLEHPDKIKYDQTVPSSVDYTDTIAIKSKKIENITPDVCFVLQLSQVPGFSMKLAQEIITCYPRWSNLIQALQEKGEKAVTDIPGIGPKKAKALVEFLL
jgi:crossover junction endonuclease MUS81